MLQTPEDYDDWIAKMEASPDDRQTISVQAGLNFKSVLNDLQYFSCLL